MTKLRDSLYWNHKKTREKSISGMDVHLVKELSAHTNTQSANVIHGIRRHPSLGFICVVCSSISRSGASSSERQIPARISRVPKARKQGVKINDDIESPATQPRALYSMALSRRAAAQSRRKLRSISRLRTMTLLVLRATAARAKIIGSNFFLRFGRL